MEGRMCAECARTNTVMTIATRATRVVTRTTINAGSRTTYWRVWRHGASTRALGSTPASTSDPPPSWTGSTPTCSLEVINCTSDLVIKIYIRMIRFHLLLLNFAFRTLNWIVNFIMNILKNFCVQYSHWILFYHPVLIDFNFNKKENI